MKKGQVGVGINWIKDKNGEIKFWPGENPFDYLGLEVSKDGKTINFFENKNGSWLPYKDCLSTKNVHFKNSYGRSFTFSHFYKKYSYDWDNGKANFTGWIEEAAKKVGR